MAAGLRPMVLNPGVPPSHIRVTKRGDWIDFYAGLLGGKAGRSVSGSAWYIRVDVGCSVLIFFFLLCKNMGMDVDGIVGRYVGCWVDIRGIFFRAGIRSYGWGLVSLTGTESGRPKIGLEEVGWIVFRGFGELVEEDKVTSLICLLVSYREGYEVRYIGRVSGRL